MNSFQDKLNKILNRMAETYCQLGEKKAATRTRPMKAGRAYAEQVIALINSDVIGNDAACTELCEDIDICSHEPQNNLLAQQRQILEKDI